MLDDIDGLLTENRIFKMRNVDIGVLSEAEVQDWGLSGVMARGSGLPWDLRRAQPYECYDEFDFQIPVGKNGDNYDRYLCRMAEMRESTKIIRQAVAKLRVETGDVLARGKVTPPTRGQMKTSMEALIHHFKLYTEGFHVPAGEVYAAVEAPKGEFGVYLVADGTNRPYRAKIRSSDYLHLQAIDHMAQGATSSPTSRRSSPRSTWCSGASTAEASRSPSRCPRGGRGAGRGPAARDAWSRRCAAHGCAMTNAEGEAALGISTARRCRRRRGPWSRGARPRSRARRSGCCRPSAARSRRRPRRAAAEAPRAAAERRRPRRRPARGARGCGDALEALAGDLAAWSAAAADAAIGAPRPGGRARRRGRGRAPAGLPRRPRRRPAADLVAAVRRWREPQVRAAAALEMPGLGCRLPADPEAAGAALTRRDPRRMGGGARRAPRSRGAARPARRRSSGQSGPGV